MDNVPKGLIIVVYRGSEEPKSTSFLPKMVAFPAKLSLEIWNMMSLLWGEFYWVSSAEFFYKSWLIIALTQLITSSTYEKNY